MLIDRLEGNSELKTSVRLMLGGRRMTHSVLLVGEEGLGTGFAARCVAADYLYPNGGAPAEAETLTDRDRFNEYVMTRLRTAEGIDLREAERLFGKERAARVLRDAEPWLKSRTLVLAAGRMAVPPARMLVSDAVIETFFETEPDTATK